LLVRNFRKGGEEKLSKGFAGAGIAGDRSGPVPPLPETVAIEGVSVTTPDALPFLKMVRRGGGQDRERSCWQT